MDFKVWFEQEEDKAKVLAHIAGPSGCGKTTLVEKLNKYHKGDIIAKDLDDFETAAIHLLGWSTKARSEFNPAQRKLLAIKKQHLLDDFLRHIDKPVILAGHHKDGEYVLVFNTPYKFYLDVSAETCARRAIRRDDKKLKGLGRKVKARSKKNMETSVARKAKKNQDLLVYLRQRGYFPQSEENVMNWVKKNKPSGRNA
jgi:uridine kinase